MATSSLRPKPESEASALLSSPPSKVVIEFPAAAAPPLLLRHDSEFSVGSAYEDGSPNDLTVTQGATLLTADCLGVGLLALPGNLKVLGWGPGLFFLLLNLPLNLFAGTLLAASAAFVEERQKVEDRLFTAVLQEEEDLLFFSGTNGTTDYQALNSRTATSHVTIETTGTAHTHLHHDTATYDFIGMTQALFRSPRWTRCVMLMYYVNIFLVLGDYILVMSHAVVAASGDAFCLPTAGLVASAGMFVVSQLRTMAGLGRSASILSLAALFVVVVQCLVAAHQLPLDMEGDMSPRQLGGTMDPGVSGRLLSLVVSTTLLKQLSALGSIGFAVGSQKLFLNIRHELRDRKQAPRTLLYALTAFGSVYILIILLAGADPPAFLFDAIPAGTNRRVAGLLLWAHVMVSYAINSQAICASLERLVSPRLPWLYGRSPATRWTILTGSMAVAAYTVANAIPFFDDLVALIGAMTSVPLTLLLPVLFWRKQWSYPLWRPSADSLTSYALLAFAVVFMLTATLGSLYSIDRDWQTHGPPFSCR